jgi:two-component system cell cycle response regulator DivK
VRTILLIDGHEDSRRIYRAFLRHHGYHTLEAADPPTGSRLASECAPDLVVLSAFLPRIDAAVVREWPLRGPAAAGIPIVLLTAHPLAAAERALLGGLCDAHLVKPCPPSTLLAEGERLLRRNIEA